MPECRITECSSKDIDSAETIVGLKEDEWQKKNLKGRMEILNHECADNVAPLQISRNMEAALRQAGFRIIYSEKGNEPFPMVTAQKGRANG